MESITAITLTIALQVSIIFIAGLSWCYAAFKVARAAHNRKLRRDLE
ncbi:hypothetical protein [Nitrospira sp. KM1]|nr:hypothetical protein [Nitrospira sp. KM1]